VLAVRYMLAVRYISLMSVTAKFKRKIRASLLLASTVVPCTSLLYRITTEEVAQRRMTFAPTKRS